MKKLTLFLLILGGMILFNACGEKNIKEGFTYEPEKPRPGDEVTIYYKPTDQRFMDADSLECRYYLAKGNDPIVFAKQIEKKEDYFTAVVKTDEETRLVYLTFLNKELDFKVRRDNNDSTGYIITLFDDDDTQTPGTLAELGLLKTDWDYLMFTERNMEKGFELLAKEFEINPDMKSEYIDKYLYLASEYDGIDRDSLYKEELTRIAAKDVFTEAEYNAITKYYRQEDRQEVIDKIIKYFTDHHPKSQVLQDLEEREIVKLRDPEKILTAYAEFVKKYPESNPKNINTVILKQFGYNTDIEKAAIFLDTYQNNITATEIYNPTWGLLQEGKLELANIYMSVAIEIAKNSLTDFDKKQTYHTVEQWQNFQKYDLGKYLARKGQILTKLGEDEEAVPFLEKAVEFTLGGIPAFNELYVELLIKTEQYETAIEKVKEFCEAGKKSEKLIDMLGEAYIKVHGSDEGLTELTRELILTDKQKLREKLKKEWSDIPAPSFTLKDLDGNDVSLSDYKGKIVVLYFWATWCAPCRASFPGLQKTVDLYKDDDSVSFLFINTLEGTENPLNRVSQFIEENGYTFHVLLDVDGEVQKNYRIIGIGRKFVIDAEGIIRFKSIGYEGSNDELIKHLTEMIEITKEKS